MTICFKGISEEWFLFNVNVNVSKSSFKNLPGHLVH